MNPFRRMGLAVLLGLSVACPVLAAQSGASQSGASQSGASQGRASQIGATQNDAGQTGAGQTGAVPMGTAQTASATPVTLDQIMATVRTVRHVDARYVEHRTLHVLRAPIETRGVLRFDAPAHLEKAADPAPDGTAETLTIDGDQLTIDRGTATAPVVLSLREHPEIGVLVESIRATLSGDAEALQRIFDVTPSGTLGHWQLVLQPRDPAQHAALQWMRVSGYAARITTIETADHDGDRSEMAIVEQTR
jgi:hypothetical protein